jgi:hypothetical protein
MHFDATLAASPQACCLNVDLPLSTQEAKRQSTLLEHRGPSAYPEGRTLFFTSEEASHMECEPRGKGHPQGVATLSMALALQSLAASFSSQRSWASLFRAFLQLHDPFIVSNERSALALSYQTQRA